MRADTLVNWLPCFVIALSASYRSRPHQGVEDGTVCWQSGGPDGNLLGILDFPRTGKHTAIISQLNGTTGACLADDA
jgi:hypothetical protein